MPVVLKIVPLGDATDKLTENIRSLKEKQGRKLERKSKK
jgi:hypothetical protein